MPGAPTERLNGLDGLRALAVGLVILTHFGAGALFRADTTMRAVVESLGVGGVDVFFTISGLLITHLILVEEDREGRVFLGLFYGRRAVRILPPAYAYFAVLAILTALGHANVTWPDLARCATFVRNWNPYSSAQTAHIWSLSIEEQFYLFWPATLWVVRSRKTRIWIAAILVLLAPIYQIIVLGFFSAQIPYPMMVGRTDFHYLPILSGCLLALALHTERGARWLGSRLLLSYPALFVSIAVVLAYWASPYLGAWTAIGMFFQSVAIVVGINFVVQRSDSRVSDLLNSRPLVMLGKMSFSVYLWQQLFSKVHWDPWIPAMAPSVVREFPLNVVMTGILAFLSWNLIERPLQKVRARLRP